MTLNHQSLYKHISLSNRSLTSEADYVLFVVLSGLSSSLSNPSIQASLNNSQLHSSLSNPSLHTSLRLSSLSNPPPTGMASSPRRRPAPISPLMLSPGGDQRRSLSKQLSPTMSPSLSPITQVRKCSLNASHNISHSAVVSLLNVHPKDHRLLVLNCTGLVLLDLTGATTHIFHLSLPFSAVYDEC